MDLINFIEGRQERLSWEEYFMSICVLVSKRSPCSRLNVGCVLVKDNRIIASGYNGFLPGAPHISYVRDNHEQKTIHAETNAIADCARRGVSCMETTAYVTHYPCVNCAKNLLGAGVTEIIYLNDYKNDQVCEMFYCETGVNIKKFGTQ